MWNQTVYNEHICEASFFWSFFVVAHFHPSSVTPSSPSHHPLIITVPTYCTSLTLWLAQLMLMLFCSLPSADPPPIPPCPTITTSPTGQTSAPCICPMKGVGREATTASSRRRRSSPTGLEPSTSTFTSQTGSRCLLSPDQTAHAHDFWVEPGIQTGGVEMFAGW